MLIKYQMHRAMRGVIWSDLTRTRSICFVVLLGCFGLVIAACTPSNNFAADETAVPGLVATLTSTPTRITDLEPTLTAISTWTSTPTLTAISLPTQTLAPTPLPTKTVLIQIEGLGGDGGTRYDFYLGLGTPSWVLYTDGQLLMAGDHGLEETTLTTTEMCELLKQITNTGFFQVEGTGQLSEDDPIYKFGPSVQFSDGGPAYIIQANGSPAKYVDIYFEYEQYLVRPIKAALEVLNHYKPVGMEPYQPEKLVLWIEKGSSQQALWDDATIATPLQIQNWPSDLPPLADLLGDQLEGEVYIQGDLVKSILQLHNQFGIFNDRGNEYFVIVRPLLPHETSGHFSLIPSEAINFDLPFKCKG